MVNSSIRFFYNGLYNKRFKKRFDESYGFSSTLGSNYKVGEYTVNISNGFQQCSQKISISGTACAPAATAPDFCAGQPFNANLLGDPLPNLTVGDIITAGAFEYTITQVSSATLPFAGKATMNILNGPANLKAGLKTEFAGININECYQVTLVPPITTTTYFRSEYDPSWGNIFDASTNTPKPAEPGEEINALIAVNEKIATEMEAFTNGCAQRERLVQYLAELNAIMAQIQASIYYNSTEKTDIANSQNAVTIVLNSLVGVGGCLTACDPNARVAAPASVNCVVAIDVETTNANLILANEAKIAELNRDGLKIKYVNRIINGKTLYSCNCGWIDTDHGFAGSTQINPAIGLDNLWRNLKNQTGKKSNSYGYNGFKISYRQEAKGLGSGNSHLKICIIS